MTQDTLPPVDVIVAARNEARLIEDKVANLLALDYPQERLRVIVADGASTDDTPVRLARLAARYPRLEWFDAGEACKAKQINAALQRCRAPWVLVTDADARMPADTLRRLVTVAGGSPGIAVVGTPLVPAGAHPIDGWHWRLSNMLRRWEDRLGTTGLVVAPCYLFRRSLLEAFPEDVVADDAHVACKAAATRQRVTLADVRVTELRTPTTGGAWLRVKQRRALGYLREVIRFLPSVPDMTPQGRVVFLWRALALTAVPVAAVAAVVALALAQPAAAALAGAATSVIGAAGLILKSRPWPLEALRCAVVPLWLVAIALAALVVYPFRRPVASYERLPLADESEAW